MGSSLLASHGKGIIMSLALALSKTPTMSALLNAGGSAASESPSPEASQMSSVRSSTLAAESRGIASFVICTNCSQADIPEALLYTTWLQQNLLLFWT